MAAKLFAQIVPCWRPGDCSTMAVRTCDGCKEEHTCRKVKMRTLPFQDYKDEDTMTFIRFKAWFWFCPKCWVEKENEHGAANPPAAGVS